MSTARPGGHGPTSWTSVPLIVFCGVCSWPTFWRWLGAKSLRVAVVGCAGGRAVYLVPARRFIAGSGALLVAEGKPWPNTTSDAARPTSGSSLFHVLAGETFYTKNEIYEGPQEERTVFDTDNADERWKSG